jgi:hypothetical protein
MPFISKVLYINQAKASFIHYFFTTLDQPTYACRKQIKPSRQKIIAASIITKT